MKVSLSAAVVAAAVLMLPVASPAASPGALEQELGPGVEVSAHSETRQVRFIGTDPKAAIEADGAGARQSARDFLSSYAAEFGLRRDAELEVSQVERLDDGRAVVRYQQIYDGVPVIGGELAVNLDASGDVLAAAGELEPARTVETDASVSAAEADDIALAAVAREYGISAEGLAASEPELSIFDSRLLGGPGLERPELVWRIEVTAADPAIRQLVLVDATLGAVVLSFNQIAEAPNRVVCDAASSSSDYPCVAPYDRTEASGPSGVADVNSAFDFAGDTYDFFFDRFGRDSLDGAGMQLVSTVRYCPSGCPYNNAFWDGEQMVYGPGLAIDDVVGHELTHGVTDFSSHLFYYYQSGAINESMSDVFGEFVDLTNGAGVDGVDDRWKVGEEAPSAFSGVCTGPGNELRNMQDPTLCGDPDKITSGNYWATTGDNGGVHTNSGVNNKATFLMTDGATFNGHTVTGLGIDKVARIYYETNNNLLTSASDYEALADALRQACSNLVGTGGITSANCTEVNDALLATEMDTDPPTATTTPAPTCEDHAVTTPNSVFFDNLENPGSGNWASGPTNPPPAPTVNHWFYPQNSHPFPFDATYATSGDTNFWGYDRPTTADSSIAMTANAPVPTNGYMRFDHAHDFEQSFGQNWDGGVVEYSTNGGASWSDAGPLFMDHGYSGGPISSADTNPLAGRAGFVGVSRGYTASRLDLSSLAGQDIRFRFRIGTDSVVDDLGWFIDDVRIYNCAPDTSIDSGPANGSTINTSSTSFGFSSPFGAASFECSLDGGAYAPCTSPRNLTGLADGSHTFRVRAKEGASIDPTPAQRTFTVDTPDLPPGPPPDTELEDFEVDAKKTQKLGKKLKIKVGVGCGEPCSAEAGGKVKVKGGGNRPVVVAAKKKYGLKKASAEIAAGERKVLKLTLKVSKKKAKKAVRALRKALKQGKKVRASIGLDASDDSGNSESATLTVQLKK